MGGCGTQFLAELFKGAGAPLTNLAKNFGAHQIHRQVCLRERPLLKKTWHGILARAKFFAKFFTGAAVPVKNSPKNFVPR